MAALTPCNCSESVSARLGYSLYARMVSTHFLRLIIALIVILAVCEAISALEHGNSGYKGSPQRRRNRLVQVPLDLEDKDPEDPDQLEEELEPTRPSMVENAATPKLVKGLNFKGESTSRDTICASINPFS